MGWISGFKEDRQSRLRFTSSVWWVALGDIHTIPLSHGEGRFVASTAQMQQLMNAGQVATQYVAINVPGLKDQQLFQAGIDYFR